MTNQALTPEHQARLFDRFGRAAEHIHHQIPMTKEFHIGALQRDAVILAGKQTLERTSEKGHDQVETIISVGRSSNGFEQFTTHQYTSSTGDENNRVSKTLNQLSLNSDELSNITPEVASKMINIFASATSGISHGTLSYERVLELVEGHHLNEQEQKAPGRDRAELLVDKLTMEEPA